MFARSLLLYFLGLCAAVAAPTLKVAATAKIGADIAIEIAGADNPRDFVTIVPADTRPGRYDTYVYATKPVVTLRAPSTPGNYEIRLLGANSPYPTLASQPIKLEAATATLDAPEQVDAGATFQVNWTGPNNARDYIGIGNAGQRYLTYVYTSKGSPLTLKAPDESGDYELRYFLASGDAVIATRKLSVGAVSAKVTVAREVIAGGKLQVTWEGPNNPRDFITIVKAGTPDKRYATYAYTAKGNPAELRAPDEPGEYEVRYLTASSYLTLATAKVSVAPANAFLKAPASAVAGTLFDVTWQGPNNQRDYVTIVPKGAREGDSGNYQYTAHGNPLKLRAPLAAGDYELRYSTSQSHATLARAAVQITPAQVEPGLISVTATSALPPGSGVEIILDASGSMLQRIGSQRRIDIAKQTLLKLTSSTIPAGTPFALRVFGREVDSCQTDLDVPLGALDAAKVSAKINAFEAKNNAKTPIGASLDKVAEDLSSVRGERLVIVLTDGEETCGGDR